MIKVVKNTNVSLKNIKRHDGQSRKKKVSAYGATESLIGYIVSVSNEAFA